MVNAEELTSNAVNDPIAKTYGMVIDKDYTQYLKYLLLERFITHESVCLDIGIANGLFAVPIAPNVKEVHGVDISKPMLEECQININNAGLENIYTYERSATNVGFDDAMFDVVYSYSTLLLVPDIQRAFKEIVRVLKPNGIAILDITGKRNLSQKHWSKFYQEKGHFGLNAYYLREIKDIFTNLGFNILETHPTGFLDQWRYTRYSHRLGFLNKLIHRTKHTPDLDCRVSRLVPALANRWYFVLRKQA